MTCCTCFTLLVLTQYINQNDFSLSDVVQNVFCIIALDIDCKKKKKTIPRHPPTHKKKITVIISRYLCENG